MHCCGGSVNAIDILENHSVTYLTAIRLVTCAPEHLLQMNDNYVYTHVHQHAHIHEYTNLYISVYSSFTYNTDTICRKVVKLKHLPKSLLSV